MSLHTGYKKIRFNNYKTCNRKFNVGATSVPQVELFRHFTGEGHHGSLKDVCGKVIERLTAHLGDRYPAETHRVLLQRNV